MRAARASILHVRDLVLGHDEDPAETAVHPEEQDDEADIGFKTTDPKYKAMKATFEMIDSDNSGSIEANELMDLLNFRGMPITELEASAIIRMYSQSDPHSINFRDFIHVMRDFEGAEVIDLTRAFVKHTTANAMPRKRGSHRESVTLLEGIGDHERNARLECGKIVDGPKVHSIIFVLIVLDVICVIMELLLHATWCDDPALKHRRLSDSGQTNATAASSNTKIIEVTPGFCSDCAKKQYDWEHVLHTISVTILALFAVQIMFVMCAYRLKFFKNAFFVLDAVVVGGALILELGFHVKEGALLVVLLTWRMGRIIHGLVTTLELGHKKMHSKINNVLLAQIEKKAGDMKGLQERMKSLNVAKGDLQRLQTLLQPTALTLENVDDVPSENLRRHCKLQIMNNHDVMETLADLTEHLNSIESQIESHIEDAAKEKEHIESHSHHPAQKSKHEEAKLRKAASDAGTLTHASTSPSLTQTPVVRIMKGRSTPAVDAYDE